MIDSNNLWLSAGCSKRTRSQKIRPIRWPPYRPVQPSSMRGMASSKLDLGLVFSQRHLRDVELPRGIGWDGMFLGMEIAWSVFVQKKKNCCWLCFVSIFIAQNQGIQHDSTSHSNLGMLWRLSWGDYGDVFYASNVAGQKCPMEFDAFPKTSIQCGASA